jgi:hypothetical protein
MRIFYAQQSPFSDVASPHSFSYRPTTVDLGVTTDFVMRTRLRATAEGLLAVFTDLDSEVAITGAIKELIRHVETVGDEARALLASLKA